MCLRVKINTKGLTSLPFNVAEEDIICYKVLVFQEGDGVYYPNAGFYTPYLDMEVKLGKKYEDDKVVDITAMDDVVEVDGGVFHLFADYHDALREAKDWKSSAIVEAVIPKDAKYIEGIFKCGGIESRSYGSYSLLLNDARVVVSVLLFEPCDEFEPLFEPEPI